MITVTFIAGMIAGLLISILCTKGPSAPLLPSSSMHASREPRRMFRRGGGGGGGGGGYLGLSDNSTHNPLGEGEGEDSIDFRVETVTKDSVSTSAKELELVSRRPSNRITAAGYIYGVEQDTEDDTGEKMVTIPFQDNNLLPISLVPSSEGPI